MFTKDKRVNEAGWFAIRPEETASDNWEDRKLRYETVVSRAEAKIETSTTRYKSNGSLR
jgi:hypothetical protein